MIIGTEWIILGIIVILLLFGAQKLPEFARSIGRALGEFEKGKVEIEKEIAEAKRTLSTTPAPARVSVPRNPASATPAPALTSQSRVDREKLLKAAEELGIETEGKTDEEIKAEVSKAVS